MLHSQHLHIEGFYKGTGACSPRKFSKIMWLEMRSDTLSGQLRKEKMCHFWSVFCPIFTQIWQSRVVASSRESCRGCAETDVWLGPFFCHGSHVLLFIISDFWKLAMKCEVMKFCLLKTITVATGMKLFWKNHAANKTWHDQVVDRSIATQWCL